MPTYQDQRDFKKAIIAEIPDGIIDTAIDWIKSNLKPEDVFSEDDLQKWAQGMEVASIYPEKDLIDWAENNGYIKE